MPFGIKSEDRSKHVYVIGKTGMGKSTLLENMAIQDIQNGEGLAFIDPHGKTAELLLDYVPEHRIKDVIYFAPFDMENPPAFNIMEDIGPDKRHLVVAGLMSAFKKIWVDAWSARMEYILQNTLLALLEYPGATLLGINKVLSDKDYRKAVVDNISDPTVKSFWIDEFAKYTERFAAEATPAIQNKVGQFTSNPLIRNIIGQAQSTFDLREVVDQKKIMIVNLSKGLVGEGNATLLGTMLITKLYLAAMSRADVPLKTLEKLPNFYLYVDEFQSFANESFVGILSEARKYKLNLTLAHQYLEQMDEEMRAAVIGNVGTMIAFRVGAFDAEILEKEFAPQFTAEDLVNLGVYQIYLKLMIDGVSSSPFSATTLPPIDPPTMSHKQAVIENSKRTFGRPRAIIEKNITEQLANPAPARSKTSAPATSRVGTSAPRGVVPVIEKKEHMVSSGRVHALKNLLMPEELSDSPTRVTQPTPSTVPVQEKRENIQEVKKEERKEVRGEVPASKLGATLASLMHTEAEKPKSTSSVNTSGIPRQNEPHQHTRGGAPKPHQGIRNEREHDRGRVQPPTHREYTRNNQPISSTARVQPLQSRPNIPPGKKIDAPQYKNDLKEALSKILKQEQESANSSASNLKVAAKQSREPLKEAERHTEKKQLKTREIPEEELRRILE